MMAELVYVLCACTFCALLLLRSDRSRRSKLLLGTLCLLGLAIDSVILVDNNRRAR